MCYIDYNSTLETINTEELTPIVCSHKYVIASKEKQSKIGNIPRSNCYLQKKRKKKGEEGRKEEKRRERRERDKKREKGRRKGERNNKKR